jgi:hypothetical protein
MSGGVPHNLEALTPCLAPVLGFGQFSQVDDEVRGDARQALADVAGVERLEPDAHQRDAAAPAPAPRPFPRPTQLRQTFPRRRRLPQSAGLAQSAYRRYSAMGVLGSAIGLITPITPTLSAAASAISASSRVRARH